MARSKAYPTQSLPKAVSYARQIWKEHGRKQMTLEEATKAIGFKGISGPSRSRISAMKQYGLMEEGAHGALKLSSRAIDILHKAKAEPGHVAAIQAAIDGVDLFTTLRETHAEASEGAIASYLLTEQGFSEVGATRAARSFLETMEFAGTGVAGKLSDEDDGDEDGDDDEKPPLKRLTPPKVGREMKQETVSIGQGRASLEWPVTRTQAEWDDLDYWLQGVIRKAKRDIGAATSETLPSDDDDD